MNIVTVSLENGSITRESPDSTVTDRYIGGRGLSAHLIYSGTGAQYDPLSPDNPLIFATGPLSGTPFPMAGRFIATTKSPLTGTIFSSACGGRLGINLRKAGTDVLVLKGCSGKPSYLFVEKSALSLHDASHLWGKDKAFVTSWLKEKHGHTVSIALIGAAGEKRIIFANIENDGRFLGRGGLGAVLGSKNIKAIVVAGDRSKIPVADMEQFRFLAYECKKWLSANPITSRGLPLFGTGVLLNYMRETGLMREKNYRFPSPPETWAISGEAIASTVLKGRRACPFCPVACGRVTTSGHGPEYESLWALGVNLAIHDVENVVELNNLCNEFGLDTITTGTTIGMAIELAEKGVLETGTTYGDFPGIRRLIVGMVNGKGPGGILAQGSRRLSEQFGITAIAPQVKGLELPAYDPRGAYGQALGYATSNRGGCHMQGYLIGTEVLGIPKLTDRHAVQGKASLLALTQNISAFMDTLIMCRFSTNAIPHDYFARIVSSVTGRKLSWEDSLKAGERIWNLERLFNLREGVDKDALPERFDSVPLDRLLDEYYAVRGWSDSGIPTQERLNMLSLL